MLGGGAVTQTGVENLKTLACTFAAYKAAERNEIVDVADFTSGRCRTRVDAGGER